MSRTMWIALFCIIGLGPVIAIKLATPASLVVEAAQDQSKIEPAVVVNESGKADRLKLPDTPAKTEIVAPATKAMPAENTSTSPETINPSASPKPIKETASGHWRDANATAMSVASPRRDAKSQESKKSVGQNPPKARAEVWHCRQDAMGSLLRSLDLSPRCDRADAAPP
jgi:hypothetical protein